MAPRSALWTDVEILVAFLRREGECTCRGGEGHYAGCFQVQVGELTRKVERFAATKGSHRNLRRLKQYVRDLLLLAYQVPCRCRRMPHVPHCAVQQRLGIEASLAESHGVTVWFRRSLAGAIGVDGPVPGSVDRW